MLILILGLVLLWFGLNENNEILLIISIFLLFAGVIGLYWGFTTMRGWSIFRRL